MEVKDDIFEVPEKEKKKAGRPSRKEHPEIYEKTDAKKEAQKKTKELMKAVKKFLATKAGNENGNIPDEWQISVLMLQSYAYEFFELTYRIDALPCLTIKGRYGETPNPILAVRDKAAQRLESLLKQMGLTMKSSFQMGAVEPQVAESPLDAFLSKKKMEVR